MNNFANFHTHDPQARLLTLSIEEYARYTPKSAEQLISVGIHPWETTDGDMSHQLTLFEQAISDPRVVAIGEIGIDPLKGASINRQLEIVKQQLRLAANHTLPVIFHLVRRYDLLMTLHKKFRPTAKWAVHGFRGKPDTATMLTNAGIYLSLGPRFNTDTARIIPPELLLIETDNAPDSEIANVATAIAQARNTTSTQIAQLATHNLRRFLSPTL